MSCDTPLDTALLTDYWLDDLPEADETAVEEHLLACDVCGTRLREVIALTDGVRRLAQEGALRMVVTPAFVARARALGHRVREYAPAAGGSVQCTVTADDEFLIARLAADLRHVPRVDLWLGSKSGTEWMRLTDIPARGTSAEVLYHESMPFAKAAATQTMVVRLLAVDAGVGESVLAEYTFHHTRSLPGPGVRVGEA